MRQVRYSTTFIDQFNALLAQGEAKFGSRVVDRKRDRVYDVIDHFLVRHPNTKPPHAKLRLHLYPISKTPFVILYEATDTELLVHFIFHEHDDLRELDPTSARW
jgi:plasmid stabilization system protein ParE